MPNQSFPQLRLDFNDAMFLVPILTSYGAWIRGVCPSQEVIKWKMAVIEGLQAKLSSLQDKREGNVEGVMFLVTTDEVEAMKNSLVCFNAHAPTLLPPSPDLNAILSHCDQILVKIATTFS